MYMYWEENFVLTGNKCILNEIGEINIKKMWENICRILFMIVMDISF